MAALNLAHDLIRSEETAKQDNSAASLLQSMGSKLDSVLTDLAN
jgi:cell division protein ZapA